MDTKQHELLGRLTIELRKTYSLLDRAESALVELVAAAEDENANLGEAVYRARSVALDLQVASVERVATHQPALQVREGK